MKMFIKKVLAILLTVAVLATSTACGGTTPAPSTPDNEPEQTIFGEIKWPNSEISSLLPVPKSSIGEIKWEASYGFVIYLGETSKDEYDSYVEECMAAGFTVDYRKGDDYYYADNEDGYHLSLKYEGDDVIFIRIDDPDEDENNSEESEKTEGQDEKTEPEETEPEDNTGDSILEDYIRPEIKEALDAYEAFMDEYIAFMEKFENSDDTLSLMTEYLDYLQKYADAMEKIGALETDDMTEAESLYYAEVTLRVSQKLLDSLN